jgi:hypothetical protein
MRAGARLVAALTLAGCSYDASGNCRFDDGHNLLLLPIGAAAYGVCKATKSDQPPQPDPTVAPANSRMRACQSGFYNAGAHKMDCDKIGDEP